MNLINFLAVFTVIYMVKINISMDNYWNYLLKNDRTGVGKSNITVYLNIICRNLEE